MNIQMYVYKRNFDVQKAERFLKERRIPFQAVDLKKHKLGRRELELFARGRGVRALINVEDEAVKSHPIVYTTDQERMLDYLMDTPQFLVCPILRDGQKVVVGFDEAEMNRWLAAAQK